MTEEEEKKAWVVYERMMDQALAVLEDVEPSVTYLEWARDVMSWCAERRQTLRPRVVEPTKAPSTLMNPVDLYASLHGKVNRLMRSYSRGTLGRSTKEVEEEMTVLMRGMDNIWNGANSMEKELIRAWLSRQEEGTP
jgi:hypothetical protein